MAANIVGDAYVVVRAITAGVERDIKKAFDGVDRQGATAGERVGNSFNKGFNRTGNGRRELFSAAFMKSADQARQRLSSMIRIGYALGPAITALAGIIGNLITTLTSLVAVIGGATLPALAALAGAFTAVGIAAITAKLAFAGVGKAIQAGLKAQKASTANDKAKAAALKRWKDAEENLADTIENGALAVSRAKRAAADATENYTDALERAKEEIKELAFESEDAAINEQKAALELEKARENLARVSDLPPNSRARKEAELAFAEADLNYRRAIDNNNKLKKQETDNAKLGATVAEQAAGQKDVLRAKRDEIDAQDELERTILDTEKATRKATEARDEAKNDYVNFDEQSGAANAYADALSELSKEAQDFVKYIVSLKDEFKALKAAAGEELFPKLTEAIDNLVKNLFPKLKPLLKETGSALGDVAKELSSTITKAENLERLERIWKSSNKVIVDLGDAFSNLYEVVLILLDAARPLTEEFAKWTANITASWRETLKAQEASGELAKKFDIARGILKDLGKIIGNVFGGFGKIISANVGPGSGGQILLDYLKEATGRFKNLETIDGKPIKDFFAGAAENGTKLLSLLGNIGGEFIKLADDPGLGKFYDSLNRVVDTFGRIGGNLNNAAPAFGAFLENAALLIETLTQSGGVVVFFNTLSLIVVKINELLQTPLGQKLLEWSAMILPIGSALGLAANAATFFGKAALSAINLLLSPLRGLFTLLTTIGVATGPALAIVAAVVAVGAILVLAYKNSEQFRESINLLISAISGALKGAFNDILAAIKTVMPNVKSFGDVFKSIGDFLAVTIVPLIGGILVRSIGILSGAIQKIIYTIGAVKDAFMAVYNFIKGIFQFLTGDTEGAAASMKKSFESAFSAIKNAIKAIVAPFTGVINAISDAWNASVAKFSFTVPKWVPIIGGNTFKVPTLPRINLANFAEGGTVFPQAGGAIARVAEAGRPERIEPLDPSGLSKRDRAIIDELAAKSGGLGAQVNITVNPSAGMDERELAAIVSRQVSYSLRKGAA